MLADKVYGEFSGREASGHLPNLCTALLTQQKRTWPLLRTGYESLRQARERRVSCTTFSVLLQHNPGRMKSTLAAVSEEDTSKRPCFLCLDQLPADQKGILYRSEYLILSNPMPVFSSHFTIAHTDHRPQAIFDHIDTLLRLMADFGSGWTLLYNGPKCGASAPDHFHFQAVPSGRLPVEKEIREKRRLTLFRRNDDVALYRAKGMGREVIIIEGGSPTAVGTAFKAFLSALEKVLGTHEEPMINLIGLYVEDRVAGKADSLHSSLPPGPDRYSNLHSRGRPTLRPGTPGGSEELTQAYLRVRRGERRSDNEGIHVKANCCRHGKIWRLLVFPRRKHRPDAFFRPGDARIAVSPAVVEMGGILVTPFARDFERLDSAAVEAIFEEVSLETPSVEKALDAIRSTI